MNELFRTHPLLAPETDLGGNEDGDLSGKTGDAPKITLSEKALAERLARAEKKAQNEFLKGFGFEKPEDFKAFVDKVKAEEDTKKTDLQKAQEAARAAEQERLKVLDEAKRMKFEVSLEREALKRGVDPDKMSYVTRLVDASPEDDGTVLGAKIDALLKDMPNLKALKAKGGADFSGGTGDEAFDFSKMTAADWANDEIFKKACETQAKRKK